MLLFILFFLPLLSFTHTQAHAATVHALIIGDTNSNLYNQSITDIQQIEEGAKIIARALNYQLDKCVLKGLNTKEKNVLETLDSMQIEPDDLLLFYFTGHGFRFELNNKVWPYLYFNTDQKYLDLEHIISSIEKKKPRFAFIIADCCNVTIEQFNHKPTKSSIHCPFRIHNQVNGNVRNLLLNTSGILVVSASSPGEFSWATSEGGILTVSMLDVLTCQSDKPLNNWHDILQEVVTKTRGIQTPQYHFYSN